ncbi:MAG: helix-turn-helix transcriptional regulator [Clostridiales bacterium]|nr:helix-turn-helix transcriptional regulator [Clostridiales bacterium]
MSFYEIDSKEIMTEEIFKSDFKERYQTIEQEHELIKQVVEARKNSGLTQRSLAEKIGVSQQEISRFENEKHIPKLSNFLRIIEAVGLEIKLEDKHTVD